jgi:N-acetylmuramoyl-L-alanine amidase
MNKKRNMLFLGCFILLLLFSISSITFPIFVSQTIGKKNVILIDPGHGGSDPGKVGAGNVLEKDINLSLSLCLKKILEKENYRVFLTRDGDYHLGTSSGNTKMSDLKKRKQLIFDQEPAAVLSIHQNSYPSSDVKGAQVFYLLGSSEGKSLADAIQTSLIRGLDPSNHRQAKSNADYYLLRENPYPTVIVECGFLSNPEECRKLQNASYRKKAAECICRGLKKYLTGSSSYRQ